MLLLFPPDRSGFMPMSRSQGIAATVEVGWLVQACQSCQMRATTVWRPVLLPHGCAACISGVGEHPCRIVRLYAP